MASDLSQPSVKHLLSSTVSFFLGSQQLFQTSTSSVSIPLRRDRPASLSVSESTLCPMHRCIPAQGYTDVHSSVLLHRMTPLLVQATSFTPLSCWFCQFLLLEFSTPYTFSCSSLLLSCSFLAFSSAPPPPFKHPFLDSVILFVVPLSVWSTSRSSRQALLPTPPSSVQALCPSGVCSTGSLPWGLRIQYVPVFWNCFPILPLSSIDLHPPLLLKLSTRVLL